MCLWFTAAWWVWQLIQDIREIPKLWEMHNFFQHLLKIPDSDIQTVSWQYVVKQLMELRKHNYATADDMPAENRRFLNGQSKQRMDAHDIANRLMRIENYWIALVNKEILDCNVNIPFFGKRQFYTKVIEWNLGAALTDFVFDDTLQVKSQFRSAKYRRELIKVLKRRFFIIGCLCVVGALPLACYFIIKEFFMMFTEYQKNPAELGARSFSPMALWKFREFNEVNHIFERRTRMALPYASQYLAQFPKDKMSQLFRFTAFVSGALAAVLGLVTIFDSQLFLGFEIAGHTSLFWLSILTPIYMAARAGAPDEEMVLDPEFALRSVIDCTHYCPVSWRNRLHSDEVRVEFSALYQIKLVLWLEELASIILAPFVFIFSLPNCAEQLVDFFREFTIHVDGLGHVCSFAVFDFKRAGENTRAGQRPGDHLREDYYGAKDDKLMESYMHFMDIYGENPTRRGNRHQTRRRTFLPPPSFPAMGASGALGFDAASRNLPHVGGVRGGQSIYQHTPRFGPATSHGLIGGGAHHASPMHSILLDPHHQPRQSPRQAPHRHRSRLDGDLEDVEESAVAEEEGGGGIAKGPVPQKTSSKVLEEDSELGDSWALRAQGKEEQDEGRNEDGVDGDKGVGVLGLLYQFQKAQTEGRAGTHL
jgi:autophagy-related protein 9